ncbi:ATPase SWSAP1 [Anabas testudineus]|uniref:ATPase SWSAP1 n=1 Tax=Anabas testudineus TaxID=64144 RepID=UPI000E4595B1|nr:ATPase SWSAP1 [Anabas testudineus]
MAEFLTLVFRTFMSESGLKKTTTPGPPPPTAAGSTLLVGHRGTSRSVLLLAAVTAASELGTRVVFFSQTQIQSLPVSLQKSVPGLSPESLKKIVFSYPRTVEELLQQVARLHESTNTTPPALIVVDGLEDFLCAPGRHPGEQSRAAHLSALLCDTATFFTQVLKQRSSSSAPCRILASFYSDTDPGQADGEASATDAMLNVLDRYFQVRCTLDQDRGYEAAAAGLQELWHVYLSGRGVTDDKLGGSQEWQLLVFPNGSVEFKLV